LVLELFEMLIRARHDGSCKLSPQPGDLRLERPAIREFQETNAFGRRPGQERPERTLDPCNHDAFRLAAPSRRLPEGARERLPEAAVRLIAIAQRHVVQAGPVANLLKCLAHASSSAIRLKGHPVMLIEITPCPCGVDA